MNAISELTLLTGACNPLAEKFHVLGAFLGVFFARASEKQM